MKAPRRKREWAREEFGGAELGDARRVARLVQVGAAAATLPAGQVTRVFSDSAEREGAYRFLENDAVEASAIVAAAARNCATRAKGPYIVVPVDQCTLTLSAATNNDSFGPVGTSEAIARGVEVINAIAVTPEGEMLGVAAQRYFVRPNVRRKKKANRPLDEKETRHWLEAMDDVETAFKGAGGRPWFQVDRGADARDILHWASVTESWVTIRACQDRTAEGEIEGKLWSVVAATSPVGTHAFTVKRKANRASRRVELELRATEVFLPLKDGWTKKSAPVVTYAVEAKEVSPVPSGEEPIHWMLLVNKPTASLAEAVEVVNSYTHRWKIEEVHRTWKTTCTVEESGLESHERFCSWAAILFAIAVRVERLKRLARLTPTAPASEELSEWEIKALLLFKDKRGFETNRMPTIAEAVLWLATLGGYTGKSSGGPPGAQTIGRGLEAIRLAADAVRVMSK